MARTGRPRKDDPTEAVTLRVRRSTLARWKQRYGEDGWRDALQRRLDPDLGPVDSVPCDHPKQAEKVHQYGVWCSACGTRIR